MPIIPLNCPNCGGHLTIDSSHDAALCEHCGTPFVVKDAIVQNYIQNVTNINADTVNIYTQKDFVIRAGVLEKYNGESPNVVIPDTVKIIGEEAFRGTGIEHVVIPESVHTISDYAFCECMCLKELTIPKSVTLIGYGAFWNCDELEEFTDLTGKFDFYDNHDKFGGWKMFQKKQQERTEKQKEQEREQREKEYQQQKLIGQRKRDGLCQHCGGKFKGLLLKQCSVCGKAKDY